MASFAVVDQTDISRNKTLLHVHLKVLIGALTNKQVSGRAWQKTSPLEIGWMVEFNQANF